MCADRSANLSADEFIRLLALQPHPEGGHYRETFRDSQNNYAISGWHRVDAAEVWHWYAGAPLMLSIAEGAEKREIRLGTDLLAGERPQAVVPARAWQQAHSLGDWTLVGCTVAPGFEFAGFELAPPGFDPVA